MNSRGVIGVLVAAVLAGAVVGCEYLPGGLSEQADLEDDEFGELGDGTSETGVSEGDGFGSDAIPELALKLELGQRFPLYKTVEQRLTQSLAGGVVTGHSRLDLQLSLVVEEVRDLRRRLGVRYHRVLYRQDLGGQTVEYNSDQPAASIPAEALPYAGLKDNGFSFWVGADNQVLEVVGFSEFLQRCVQHVAADQRPAVLMQLRAMRSDDGLANFVDDSIGLLPNPAAPQQQGRTLAAGSSWDLPARTVSVGGAVGGGSVCTMRCLLKELTETTAEIALVGSIGPSSSSDELRQIRLTVRGGQCSGACTVDRSTGMPTKSRVERTLDMIAQLPDGTEIPQRKEVITTMVAYLEQGGTHTTTASEAQTRPAGEHSVRREESWMKR